MRAQRRVFLLLRIKTNTRNFQGSAAISEGTAAICFSIFIRKYELAYTSKCTTINKYEEYDKS